MMNPAIGELLDFMPGIVVSAIEEERCLVIDELNRRIDVLFREHGIEIAFNQMDVYIKNMQGDEQKVESRPALPPAGNQPV